MATGWVRACIGWLLAAWLVSTGVHAADCEPVAGTPGLQRCRAGLPAEQLARMQVTQEQSQWCWAASIAMVFAHHGFVVPQEQVVERRFGARPDVALSGEEITALLALGWTDAQGRDFVPVPTPVAPGTGPSRAGVDLVLQELSAGRPLIVGAEGHAMVLVRAEWEEFTQQHAVRLRAAWVLDPARGQGLRQLRTAELRPTYLAAVRLAGHAQ